VLFRIRTGKRRSSPKTYNRRAGQIEADKTRRSERRKFTKKARVRLSMRAGFRTSLVQVIQYQNHVV